jgi:hypothetical protein
VTEVLQQVMIHNPDAACRVIDGEAFIITPHDNQIHNLTEVATRVWELGGEGMTVGEIVAAIVEEYEVEAEVAERDVIAFVRDLEERHIVTLKDQTE